MTDKKIPLTMYNVRQPKPDRKFGTPASVVLNDATSANEKWALVRGSMKAIPDDANVTYAEVRVYAASASASSITISAAPNQFAWGSSVHWSNRPTPPGTTIASATVAAPAVGALFAIPVTAWASTRDNKGLVLRVNVDADFSLKGSSAAELQPYLFVQYNVAPDPPGNLRPSGGGVSVAKPDLTFDGPDDMSAFQIQFSTNGGSTIAFDTGVLPGTTGYYVQAAGSPTPASGSTTISWRVAVTNPSGASTLASCPWASYTYEPLPVVTITNPVNGSNQIDGTPPLNWSVVGGHGQSAWKAEYRNAVGKLIDDSNGFADDSVTRTWTPSTGIAVPADAGTYRLVVKDDSVTRAGAANAPTQVEVTSSFVTVESSAVSGITGLAVNIVNGAVTLTGNRGAGAPDNVSVLRDNKKVYLWDIDGDPLLMPGGAKFFTGGNFSIPDYTCDLRRQHTWKIVTYVGGTAAGSATIVARPFDGGCYLIDPVTGFKIEVWGQDDVPSVEEIVTENSILHVPVTGGPIVEPVRRRLTRTTKAGTITGVVQDSDATTLQGWVEGPQQKRFRLVYGIANLSVILGDYNPQNVFYSEQLSAERTLFTLNWWERLNP